MNRIWFGVSLIVIGGIVAACNLPGVVSEEQPREIPTMAESLAATVAEGEQETVQPDASSTQPVPDLASGPVIFFSPAPPQPSGVNLPLPDGSEDFHELFQPDAPWSQAAEHVDIFKVHSWYIRHYASDSDLLRMFEDLRRREIPFSLEMEPLEVPDPSECNHSESFEGTYDLEMAQRIKDLGGVISVVAIEEPYAFAHKLDTPGSCQRPVNQVAAESADFVRRLRQIFPDVLVGSIEPLWPDPEIGAEDMAIWLDAYEAAAGEPFAFLHLDIPWQRRDWPEVMLEIEEITAERGIPIGIIYNAQSSAGSSELWLQRTAEHMATYEVIYGGSPDHVIFQSWTDLPDRVLPETEVSTFTGLINQYFSNRVQIEVGVSSESDQDLPTVSGKLTTLAGEPVAMAPITVEAFPITGVPQSHTIEGVVPASAKSAVIAIRVNAEGALPGDSDIRLYEVGYFEEGESTNRVRDPSFSSGFTYWGDYGTRQASIVASDQGTGRMLQLTAEENENIFIDSRPFTVSPGSNYRLTILAGVPEASERTGILSVVFLDETEVRRDEIVFEPAPIPFNELQTDSNGEFILPAESVVVGEYTIRVRYDGDINHWPIYTDQQIQVGR